MAEAKRPRVDAFTLLELLLVLVLIGVLTLAVLGVPDATHGGHKAEVAAGEVAAALRFARNEALRTAEPHGARITTLDHRVRVYRLEVSSPPFVEEFSVRHPVDKKLYDLDLYAATASRGVKVTTSQFRFGGDPTPKQSVAFSADGLPISPEDLTLLDSGFAEVRFNDTARTIDLAPMTGRVTLQ